MNRLWLLLLLLLPFSSCEEDTDNITDEGIYDKIDAQYRQKIYELGINELTEDFKWRMYCNYCDVPVKNCRSKEIEGKSFAMLDMKIFYLNYDDDTGEVAFTFLLNDSLQCSLEQVDGIAVHGFGFVKDGVDPLYYIAAGSDLRIPAGCDTLLYEEGICPERIIHPKQPEVIRFLTKYRKSLNPWLHMEAVRRGIYERD